MSKLVCVGQIVNTHGIKGVVKIKPFLSDPMDIDTFGALTDSNEKRHFDLTVLFYKKGLIYATIKNINDCTSAEALKGVNLYTLKDNLPDVADDEFYYDDLVGLTVMHNDALFGTVTSVENFGAGDIINIKVKNGQTVPFHFSDETFPSVDIKNGIMTINIPFGLEDILHED